MKLMEIKYLFRVVILARKCKDKIKKEKIYLFLFRRGNEEDDRSREPF